MVAAAKPAADVASVQPGADVVRLQRQHPIIACERFIKPAKLLQRVRPVLPRIGLVGAKSELGIKALQCIQGPAKLEQKIGAALVCAGMIWLERER